MVTQNPSTRGDKSDDERSPTTVAVGKTTTPPTIVPTEKNRGHDHGMCGWARFSRNQYRAVDHNVN